MYIVYRVVRQLPAPHGFLKKVRQVCDGGIVGLHFLIIFEIVRSDTLSIPNFNNELLIQFGQQNHDNSFKNNRFHIA